MLEITIKNYKLRKISNIFFIIQIALILLFINAEISNHSFSNNLSNNVSNYTSNLYYLSGAISNNLDTQEKSEFDLLIKKIASVKGVESVGFQYQANAYDNKKGYESSVIFINKGMREIQYRLGEGKWFTENKQSEVILGGKLCQYYKIGDKITLIKSGGDKDPVSKKQTTGIVIGYLKNPFIISLDTTSSFEDMNCELLFRRQENVVLTNDANICEWDSSIIPRDSLIIKTNVDGQLQGLKKYGLPISFEKIEENTKKEHVNFIETSGITILLVITILILGMTINSYIYIRSNLDTFVIYYICGMRKKNIVFILILVNIINIIFALGLDFVMLGSCNKLLSDIMGVQGLSIENIVLSLGYIVMVIIIPAIQICYLLKKSPIELKRSFYE